MDHWYAELIYNLSVMSLTRMKVVGPSDCILEPYVSIPLDVDHKVSVHGIRKPQY